MIIFYSYLSIVIKVRYGAQPQHHSAASRERKLTMTLLIVSVISLLVHEPFVIIHFLIFARTFKLLRSLLFRGFLLNYRNVSVLYYANHLVNPILCVICHPYTRTQISFIFTLSQETSGTNTSCRFTSPQNRR